MGSLEQLKFKIATESWEYREIHNMNYHTFVEEIPQHSSSPDKSLVDKFDEQNVYIICIGNQELHGMIAVRDKRPFSLDSKLSNLDSYLPESESICEIRLLSIRQNRRHGKIIQGLMVELGKYCDDKKYDLAIISGTVQQRKLYSHIGFESFGPLVGSDEALYQPMYLSLESYNKLKNKTQVFNKKISGKINSIDHLNFLPGPVELGEKVLKAYRKKPLSHRSENFVADFNNTKTMLCEMLQCREAAILTGSGTLANDAIAGQLSLLGGKGLILVGGEFGHRLVSHANAAKLDYDIMHINEGDACTRDAIEQVLNKIKYIEWLWCVHCETSTGVIYDVSMLLNVCKKSDIRLCLDCISSIGTMKVDLRGVYLASGVSGKSIGALPGLAIVFYNHNIQPQPTALPCYIDLGLYTNKNGIPFTISSNLLYALKSALESTNWVERFSDIRLWSKRVHECMLNLGYTIVSNQLSRSSAVITISLPTSMPTGIFGNFVEEKGFLLSYKSSYLLKRNWIQICLMREIHQNQIRDLIKVLASLKPDCNKRKIKGGRLSFI